MNATEAINRIAELLGMKFKSEKFFQTKLVDGLTTITNNIEAPFSVGDMLYVVGEDSIMTPAPAGSHETREGLILIVKEDGAITAIEEKPMEGETSDVVEESETEIESVPEVMSEATLTDGTKIMTDTEGDFKVGDKVYVITESGEKVGAPEGEHTTESGIVLTVDSESVITGVKYPDEEGEGSLEAKKEMKEMKEAMNEMFNLLKSLSHDFESYKKDYEEFKKQPNFKEPVVRKTFGKENLLDAKMRFLKDNIL